MATVTWTKTAQCAGEHVTLTRSGAFSGSRVITVSEVFNNPLTQDERELVELLLLRLFATGKTKGQLNTAFTQGVTMEIV